MPIINPWTAMAAGKAVWNGYKWVKQMKKLKKAGGSAVKQIQSGTKPKNKPRSITAKQSKAQANRKYWRERESRNPKKYWERIDK